MMKKLVLASGNKGKLKEFSQLLSPFEQQLIPQSDFNISEAEETGLTFVENAIIKARHACQQTGLPAIADDSGLEVDALQGAPGIYSSRFSGPDATDSQNIQALLDALSDSSDADSSDADRTARFQCVIVFMRHANDPTPLICQGHWEGKILPKAQGENGFGYDPVFWVEQHQCSAAELSSEQKHALSHRGKTMKQFIAQYQHDVIKK